MSPPTNTHTTPSTPKTKTTTTSTPPRSLLHTLTSSLISISTLAGGVYLVRSYTQARLEDVRMKMERDGRARDGLRTRFLQTHDDVSYTVLALLPTLGQQVGNGRGMDVESLIGELKRAGRGAKERAKEKGRIEDKEKEKEKETEGEGEAGGQREEQGGRRTSLNPLAREFVPRVGTPSSVSVDGSMSSSESVSADVDVRGVNASYPPNPYPALSSRSSSPGSASASGVSSSFVSVSGSVSGSGYAVSAVSGSGSDVGVDADRDAEGSERMSASFMSVRTEDTDTDSMVSGEGGGEREERKRSKAELWNEVKIQTFTRALTTIYATVLLCTLTTAQLTLIARANYVSSVIALEKEEKRRERMEEKMGRVLGVQGIMMEVMGGVVRKWWGLGRGKGKGREGEEEEDVMELFLKSLGGIEDDDEAEEHEDEREGEESDKFLALNLDAYAQSQFLTLSWWLLHVGHEDLAARVRESVHVALDGVGLKMALRVGDLERVIGEIRKGVEGDKDVLGNAVVPPTEEMVRMVLVKGGGDRNPADEERAVGSTTAPGKDETKNDAFTALLTELRAVVRSAEWRTTIEKGVDAAVDVLIRSVFVGGRRGSREVGQEAEEIGEEEKIRLASLLPGLARWSQLALEGLPSEVVDEILTTRELGCLSALVFGRFEDRFGAGVGVGPGA